MGIIISIALLVAFFFTRNSDLAIAAGLFWIGGFAEIMAAYFSKKSKLIDVSIDALKSFLEKCDK